MSKILKYDKRMKYVNRFSGLNMVRKNNLQEHGYMVGVIYKELCDLLELPCSSDTMIRVMRHDILEVVTGDLLYPAKNLTPVIAAQWDYIEDAIAKTYKEGELKHYSEKSLLEHLGSSIFIELWKMADFIDGWMIVKDEIDMGNTDLEVLNVEKNYRKAIAETLSNAPLSINEKLSTYLVESVSYGN